MSASLMEISFLSSSGSHYSGIGPTQIWEHAQRDGGSINGHLYSVVSRANDWIELEGRHPEVATSLGAVHAHLGNFDALVMSNGAKDEDAYLLHLARLAGVRARIVNLGALTGGYTSPLHDGATGLVAPSQYVAHRSAVDRSDLGLPIKVCPPVIDVESISHAGSSCSGDLEKESQGVMFIMVSRLATAKTPGIFLRAIGTLRRRQRERNGREVEGVLVGTGPLLERMEALSRDVDAGVRFTGFVQPGAVPCEILQATALVVPSFSSETYGMVIPEAMVLGVPVVTFGFGGTGELLRHMENGMVVSEPTPRGLADALQLLAEDRALRDRLGAQARQDAVRLLSLTRMVTCHVDAMA